MVTYDSIHKICYLSASLITLVLIDAAARSNMMIIVTTMYIIMTFTMFYNIVFVNIIIISSIDNVTIAL